MRKAKYSMRQVVCRNSSCIGYSSNVARPGYWVMYRGDSEGLRMARVLGRIEYAQFVHGARTPDVRGSLAVIRLTMGGTHANIAWVDPGDVVECYEKPPAALMAWITGPDWVKSKRDIARILAMSEYGTTSEEFISSRDDPAKPYNARPEFCAQYIIE